MAAKLTPQEHQWVFECVRSPNPAPEKLRALVRLGDVGFDAIVEIFNGETLTPTRRSYALHRLATIAMRRCHERLDEVLLMSSSVLAHPDVALRSSAATLAINLTKLIERAPKSPSPRERVQAEIRVAQRLGLSKESAAFVERFLANGV